MIRVGIFLGVVALVAGGAAKAATPTRYDVTAVITSVPASGGTSFGAKFFLAGGQVVYRIVPAGQTEGNPAAQWEYWSTTMGGRQITPAAGYAALDVRAMNVRGEVVGQMSKPDPDAKNAALYWTLAGGSRLPNGFDAGSSALQVINATGLGAGFSYRVSAGTEVRVTWNAGNLAAGAPAITPPAGASAPQVVGVAGNGDTLIYVTAADGKPRLALWDGTTSAYVGPAPATDEEFFPANAAINAAGDVVMLVLKTGSPRGAVLRFLPAADRDAGPVFTFPGAITSVYNLRFSDVGVASFDASLSGDNTVNVASATAAQQQTFVGYRSFLNAAGELIFGGGGDLFYWDAAAWTGLPQIVPLRLTTTSGGFDVQAYGDDGRILATNLNGGVRELVLLSPAGITPVKVTLKPIRRNVRLRVGERVRDRLVETRIVGDSFNGRVRYVMSGRLPGGFRFRKSEAILSGRGESVQVRKIRVAATYRDRGVNKRTPWVPITIRVRASLPTQ